MELVPSGAPAPVIDAVDEGLDYEHLFEEDDVEPFIPYDPPKMTDSHTLTDEEVDSWDWEEDDWGEEADNPIQSVPVKPQPDRKLEESVPDWVEEELRKQAEQDERDWKNYHATGSDARAAKDRKNANARLKRKQYKEEAAKRGITITELKKTGWKPPRKILSDEDIAKRNRNLQMGRNKLNGLPADAE